MVTASSTCEPPARAYSTLLQELHTLMIEGKGESAEADSIRDAMDAPWYALTAEEQDRLRGLSEDLYALAENGAPSVVMSPQERRLWGQQFKEAFDRHDWDRALTLLRRPPHDAMPDLIPFLQSRCWEQLGDLSVALVFMREAERLNPDNAIHAINLLWNLGRTADAVDYADRILKLRSPRLDELYLAGGVLLDSIQSMSTAEARPVLERIVSALCQALSMKANPPEYSSVHVSSANIACMLGVCYERLGAFDAALRTYNEAISRDPNESDVLTFRGLATLEQNRTDALKDFAQAIQVGSTSVWPYFFLAHHALELGDYSQCLSLCGDALQRTDRRALLAQLHEWSGISRFILRLPTASVLDSFEQAVALDPTNERIRRNRAVAETLVADSTRDQAMWCISLETSPEEARQNLLHSLRRSRHVPLLPPLADPPLSVSTVVTV